MQLQSVSFMPAFYSRKFKNRTQCVRVISEDSGALSLTYSLADLRLYKRSLFEGS